MTTTLCPAAVEMVLVKKGSFSYRQDNVNYLALDDKLTIRIERINNNVARVYLVDGQQVQQPVPAYVGMTNGAGAAVPPLQNAFFITWFDSYVLSVNGQPYMTLNNQKQQSIDGPAGAASGVM